MKLSNLVLLILCSCLETEQLPPYGPIDGQYRVETYYSYPVFIYPEGYTCTISFPDMILHVDTSRPGFDQGTYIDGSPMKCEAFRIGYDRMGVECFYTTTVPFLGYQWDQFLGISARTLPPYDALLTVQWNTALGAFLCVWNADATVYPWELVPVDS